MASAAAPLAAAATAAEPPCAAEFDGVALPTPELRAAAAAQLGETDAVRAAALAALRALLHKLHAAPAPDAPPLPPFDTSDAALVCLLRAKSFDVDAAAALAVNMRAFIAAHPQLFALSREATLAMASTGFMNVLAQPSLRGHRVMSIRPALMPAPGDNAWGLTGDEVSAFQLWVIDRLKRDPQVQVYGLSSFSCYAGVSFSLFIKHFKLLPLKVRVAYQRDCYAPRYGDILIYNVPRFIRAVFAVVKALLPAHVTQHVRVCDNAPPGAAAALMMPLQHVPRTFGGGLEDDGTAHMQAWCEQQLELQAVGL